MRISIVRITSRLLWALLAGWLVCAVTVVQAADSYDGKYLTIPKVLVGNTTYTNVVITVASILSVGSGAPAANYDSYNAPNKELSIPSVQYGGTTYTNVKITVGLIVSVGGSDGGSSGCPAVTGAESVQINFGTSYLGFNATSADNKYGFEGGTLTATSASSAVTFTSNTSSTPDLSGIVSTGPECGIGGINAIPTTGYQSSLSLQQGYGYVGQLGDGTYIRLYVSSVSAGPVYNIQYEYPATICPTGAVSKYTGDSSAGHAVFTFNNSVWGNAGYSGPRRFPFFGCAGAANIQVWGGGGAGGAGSDGGGGGGGGGGYVSQTLNLVPGQWYVLTIGAGGQTVGADSGTSGTDSSFAIEGGSAILTATGGKGGGWDGYNSYSYGIGGQPGGGSSNDSTSVSTKIAGTAGSNGGAVNTCGGFGTTGPAGAGGAGGFGGDGGKGGCNPGSASVPGGGGSGGSQGSASSASSGAYGEVIITWQ